MTDTMWALAALGGIALVAVANLLRFRRTEDRGCLGHFFVSAEDLTRAEWALNRFGIGVFVASVVLSLAP